MWKRAMIAACASLVMPTDEMRAGLSEVVASGSITRRVFHA